MQEVSGSIPLCSTIFLPFEFGEMLRPVEGLTDAHPLRGYSETAVGSRYAPPFSFRLNLVRCRALIWG